jgi:predicted XRE-type DNA-binding protein
MFHFLSDVVSMFHFLSLTNLIENNMKERETVVRELLSFIEHAILKQQVI